MEPKMALHKKPVLLVALGGNALIRKGQQGSIAEQFENLQGPIRQIARLSSDYRVVITHGNGPQVGNLLLQQEACREVPRLPLEILVAQTEGQIGYMIESSLDEALMEMGTVYHPLVTLITYVVVSSDDPAFSKPAKPIGPAFSREAAQALPFPTMKTAKGYRRVVASPRPVTIIEKREIRKLIQMDFIVICCGGGGIPVIREGRSFSGVDAVIDKDLASVKLAQEIEADVFLIATDEQGVFLDYDTPEKRMLSRLTPAQAEQLLDAGHFPAGSMGPKVEAAVDFVQHTGKRALITSIDHIEQAVREGRGTEFRRSTD
jgi:carbamate kinase